MFAPMAGPIRDLEDLSRKRADLRISCRDCGHAGSIQIYQALDLFRRNRWSTDWYEVARRFWCRKCGSKRLGVSADFWGAAVRRQNSPPMLKAVPPSLRPGLRPPPPGVSIETWNAADERERKRLVERARG